VDPLIRRTDDPAPWVPGMAARFEWPDGSCQDSVDMVRERVDGGGVGLYVLRLPFTLAGTPLLSLVEAYYPDQIRDGSWRMLDPRQKADYQDGRLVVLFNPPLEGTFVMGRGTGSLNVCTRVTEGMVTELRRNDRAARSDLRRSSPASYRRKELDEMHRQEEEDKIGPMANLYEDAYKESLEFALGKPRVSMYTGG